MKIGKTVLSAYSLILLLIVIGYSLINYQVLAGNGGWGIVGMFGLAGIGVALIVVDRYPSEEPHLPHVSEVQ